MRGELELRREAKVAELLGDARHDRFEASGVVAVDDVLYVIFDNTSQIGCIGRGLSPGDGENRLIAAALPDDEGYEDIAHDRSVGPVLHPRSSRCPHGHGFMAKVREYDEELRLSSASAWLDFPLCLGPTRASRA